MAKDITVKELKNKNIKRKIETFFNTWECRKQNRKSSRFGHTKLKHFCLRKRRYCYCLDER